MSRIHLSYKKEYSKQIILHIGNEAEATKLADKWEREHPGKPQVIIEIDPDLEPNDAYYEDLAELDPHSRVYIIGHHAPGLDFLQGDEKDDRIDFQQIANIFSHQVHPGNIVDHETNRQLTISITACFAAKDKENGHGDSFAANLHRELRLKGFRTEVKARTTMTLVQDDGSKLTSKIGHEMEVVKKQIKLMTKVNKLLSVLKTNSTPTVEMEAELKKAENNQEEYRQLTIKKQPGSKLKWTWQDKKQVVSDAYSGLRLFKAAPQDPKKAKAPPSSVHHHPRNV